jgi:hypothetical protein
LTPGGAIAIELANKVSHEQGTIIEGTSPRFLT